MGIKNLIKGKHKAGTSGARGPEVRGSQDHSSQNCHQWSILESLDDKFQGESTASTILVHSKAPQKSIL